MQQAARYEAPLNTQRALPPPPKTNPKPSFCPKITLLPSPAPIDITTDILLVDKASVPAGGPSIFLSLVEQASVPAAGPSIFSSTSQLTFFTCCWAFHFFVTWWWVFRLVFSNIDVTASKSLRHRRRADSLFCVFSKLKKITAVRSEVIPR